MTILKIAALSSLIVAAGLAGCSLSNYDRGPHGPAREPNEQHRV